MPIGERTWVTALCEPVDFADREHIYSSAIDLSPIPAYALAFWEKWGGGLQEPPSSDTACICHSLNPPVLSQPLARLRPLSSTLESSLKSFKLLKS